MFFGGYRQHIGQKFFTSIFERLLLEQKRADVLLEVAVQRILITGAGRGLGLALTQQYLLRGDRVFAGYRNIGPTSELHRLHTNYHDQLTLLALDVTDHQCIDSSWNTVSTVVDGLDLLINNAGINAASPELSHLALNDTSAESADRCAIERLHPDAVRRMLEVNAIGPLAMAQRYIGLLKHGIQPKIINISSDRGSLSLKLTGGNYGYCASKATLNMLTRALAFDIAQLGIVAVMLHPGWVQTDMGTPSAHLTPEQAAQAIVQVVDRLSPADTGRFLSWQDVDVPW
jgi:NAD(P)-dependent dehydrogenase (short-subunit alcohol dehydrogenase family)